MTSSHEAKEWTRYELQQAHRLLHVMAAIALADKRAHIRNSAAGLLGIAAAIARGDQEAIDLCLIVRGFMGDRMPVSLIARAGGMLLQQGCVGLQSADAEWQRLQRESQIERGHRHGD